MSDFDQQFRVWTLGQGPRGRWRRHLETGDLDEAMRHANALTAMGEWACVSELGAFLYEHKRVVGWVTFWWCNALNDEMKGSPQGRGFGWYDDEDVLVSYDYPGKQAGPWDAAARTSFVPAIRVDHAVAAAAQPYEPRQLDRNDEVYPERHYVEASCDDCGVILPMNALIPTDREVMSGRTSGTTRAFYSHGSSGHSRSGTSATSGRSYFKVQQLSLCNDCYQRELERRRDNRHLLIKVAELAVGLLFKR